MNKILKFFAKNSRWILPVLGVILLFVILPEPALAADGDVVQKTIGGIAIGGAMKIFSFVIVVITSISFVFALLVGDLIDSTFILDTGMGDTLHLVWSVMRNFVNVGFILLLLVIAAMVIFGGGGEKGLGMLKKVLPKFILALVFVNLTFFAGRFILTTNDVLATAIFTLPQTVSGDKMIKLPCPETINGRKITPEECRDAIAEKTTAAFKGGFASGTDPATSADFKTFAQNQLAELQKESYSHKITDIIDKKNVALILLTSMLDLENLTNTKGVLGEPWSAVLGGLAAIVTASAIGIIIFMLMLALIVRMVVLWICLAVSPVAALALVLGDVIPGAKMSGDMDLLSIFLKHAFMPTLVAIPLSIGLIMIFTNNTVDYNYSLNTFFSFGDSEHAGDFHALLWWIAAIAIIWVGTNAMIKKSSEYAAKVTDKIHGGVNKFVGAAAGTLKYAPIMPAWTAPMSALERMQTAGRNRHAAAGRQLLQNSSLPKSWYEAPITQSQVTQQTHDISSSKDPGEAVNKLSKLLTQLFNSSNGKSMLSHKLRDDDVLQYNRLFGTNIESGATIEEALDKIVNGQRTNLRNDQKNLLRTGLDMVRSGEEQELPELSPQINKGDIVVAGGDETVAGKALDPKKGELKKIDGMKFGVGGNEGQVYEQGGIYYVLNTDDAKDGYSAVGTKVAIDKIVTNLDVEDAPDKDRVGLYLAEKFDELLKSKDLINTEQMIGIRRDLNKAIDAGKINPSHADSLLIPVTKLLKEGEAIKKLQKMVTSSQ